VNLTYNFIMLRQRS